MRRPWPKTAESRRTTRPRAGLIAWLKGRGVRQVGLEASGGYERAIAADLAGAGFEVVMHQPAEVRLFTRLKRRKARNDRLDARLIALATAQVDTVRALKAPALQALSERMTAYEQMSGLAARLKTMLEHVTLPDVKAALTFSAPTPTIS